MTSPKAKPPPLNPPYRPGIQRVSLGPLPSIYIHIKKPFRVAAPNRSKRHAIKKTLQDNLFQEFTNLPHFCYPTPSQFPPPQLSLPQHSQSPRRGPPTALELPMTTPSRPPPIATPPLYSLYRPNIAIMGP